MATPQQEATAEQVVQAEAPQWAWLWNDPEVGPILRKGLSPAALEEEIRRTNWYRSRSDSERAWLTAVAQDPATATRKLYDYDKTMEYVSYAAQYGMQIGFDQARQQIDRSVMGTSSPDALREEVRRWAKAAYPYLATQIDQGMTVQDVFEPIKNRAAQTLGVNPSQISLADPKWTSLMQFDDGKGGRRLATDDEINTKLRLDAQYGFAQTQNGRNEGFQVNQAIGKAFGFEAP